MPYINKIHYFEYDFKSYALVDLREVMKRIAQRTYTKGMYEDVQPPIAALWEKYYEVDREFKPTRRHKRLTGNFPRLYYMQQFKDKARLHKELKAFLVSTFKAWGLHLMEKYKHQPEMLGRTGFPYACLNNLPMPSIGILEFMYKGKNMSIVLRSKNDSPQLLKTFCWECSADAGVTWFSVGESKMPEKRVTTPLEYGREYLFRSYATNPRHRSQYSNTLAIRNYSQVANPEAES